MGEGVFHLRQGFDLVAQLRKNCNALVLARPARKGCAGDITCKANTAGENNRAVCVGTGHPVGGMLHECRKSHHGLLGGSGGVVSSDEILLISSRRAAAFS